MSLSLSIIHWLLTGLIPVILNYCERLPILYRKKKMFPDEVRVLKEAIKNIPVSNIKHFEWFEDRYKKILLSQK